MQLIAAEKSPEVGKDGKPTEARELSLLRRTRLKTAVTRRQRDCRRQRRMEQRKRERHVSDPHIANAGKSPRSSIACKAAVVALVLPPPPPSPGLSLRSIV